MFATIDSILTAFRSCFSRKATFIWFVLIIFGFMIRLDTHGITSFVRCFALLPNAYFSLLHFFYASSWTLNEIISCWISIIKSHCQPITLGGQTLLVGDGIKVSKEAKRMPGVTTPGIKPSKLSSPKSQRQSKPLSISVVLPWGLSKSWR